MSAEPASGAPAPHNPLPDLAWLGGLVLAWLYTAGWAYAYRWYARFDLGLGGLDLPVETVLMYGFWVLGEQRHLVLLSVGGWLLWRFGPPAVRYWGVYALPLVLLGVFTLAYTHGTRAADARFAAHRDAGFRCLPRARVGLLPQADRTPAIAALAAELARDAPPGAAAPASASGPGPDPDAEWRLLVQTGGLLVFVKPKPQGPPVTVLVPLGSVDAVRLSPVVVGCE